MSSESNIRNEKMGGERIALYSAMGAILVFMVVNNIIATAEEKSIFTDKVCHELNEKNWDNAHDVISEKFTYTNRLHQNVIDQIRCENGEYVYSISMLSGNEQLNKLALKNIESPLFLNKNKLTYLDLAAKRGDLESFKSMHIKVNERKLGFNYNFTEQNKSGAAPLQHIVDGGNQQLFDYALNHIENVSELSKTNPELVKYVSDHGTDGMKKSLNEKTGNTKTSMIAKKTNDADYNR